MIASQVGAYQSASYAFMQRADNGVEVARAVAAQDKPEFKASLNGVTTRSGLDEGGKSEETKGKTSGGNTTATRGRFVNIVA